MKTPTRKSMVSGASPILPPFHQKIFTHATSAKRGRFSALSFLKFQIPHVSTSLSRSRGDVSRNRGSLTPSSLNPLTPRCCVAAFTLIELMAATTVLSIILLMMVGMQDQMSKAWSNSNRRTDATREARAAARMIAADLTGMSFRLNTPNNVREQFAPALTNQGIPYLYSSNGQGSFTIPNAQSDSAYLFALCNQASRGTNYADIGLVGYYIASSKSTNINGFVVTNYNLHRHYVSTSNAVSNLTSWFSSRSATSLFSGVDPATDDILARNTCNLRITFFGKSNSVTNGLNYSNIASSSGNYRGNKMQIEWTTYSDDIAQKIALNNWASSTNIKKFGRSFEFRVDLREN